MKPFKVGERVRVFIAACDAQDGTIAKPCPGGWTIVLDDPHDHVTMDAHPKQLRRLVKKSRREWWINEETWKLHLSYRVLPGAGPWSEWFEQPYGTYIRTTRPKNTDGWICVREVKERK